MSHTCEALINEASSLKELKNTGIDYYSSIIQRLRNIIKKLTQEISWLRKDRKLLIIENHQIRQQKKKGRLETIPQQSDSHLDISKMQIFREQEEEIIKKNNELLKYLSGSIQPSNLLTPTSSLKNLGNCQVNSTPKLQSVFRSITYRTKGATGLLQSFYANLISNHILYQKLQAIISEYIQFPEDGLLYEQYPDNGLMGGIILKFIEDCKENTENLLNKINSFKMIDQMLCKIMNDKIQSFTSFNLKEQLNQINIKKIFYSLGNVFQLSCKIKMFENQIHYDFYKDENLKISGRQESLLIEPEVEISLNPGHQIGNKNKQNQTPSQQNEYFFTIKYHLSSKEFSFIYSYEEVENSCKSSILQIPSESEDKKSFKYSQHSSIDFIEKRFKNHFAEVPSILSEQQLIQQEGSEKRNIKQENILEFSKQRVKMTDQNHRMNSSKYLRTKGKYPMTQIRNKSMIVNKEAEKISMQPKFNSERDIDKMSFSKGSKNNYPSSQFDECSFDIQ